MNNSSVILLDIDDTILPSISTHAGLIKDNVDLFIININRLSIICKKWDIKIALLTDWSTQMLFDESTGNIIYNGSNKLERALWKKFYDELNEHIVDFRQNTTKQTYIKQYIQSIKYKNVIVLDDTDFSSCVNHNNHSYYLQGTGFICNKMITKIKNIVEKQG